MVKAARVLEGMSSAWPGLLGALCDADAIAGGGNRFQANLKELADLVRSEDADLSDELAEVDCMD